MTNAAIYARISLDVEGDRLGVTRQVEDCEAEAERRGWTITDRYIDNDVSAVTSKVRPEYQRMMRDIENGHIQAVVVWDIDRLTRTPRELEDTIEFADKHGLSLASVGGEIDLSTHNGRLMARMKGNLARYEVEQLSRRMKRKLDQKAAAGEPHSMPGFGFKMEDVYDSEGRVTDRRLAVDASQAAILREAARRFIAGESLRRISADLTERGLYGARKPFTAQTLVHSLRRPSLGGWRVHRGEIVGKLAGVDPILDEATYKQLQAKLKDPSRRTGVATARWVYLMSGLLFCGRCDGKMFYTQGAMQTLADGTKKRRPPVYSCRSCYKVVRKIEPVDELIETVLLARLAKPDALSVIGAGDQGAVNDALKSMDTLDARLAEAADQFADGAITAEQLSRISTRLREQRDALAREVDLNRPRTAWTDLAGPGVEDKWAGLEIGQKREIIDALMKVTILPVGATRTFDPRSVKIQWRA